MLQEKIKDELKQALREKNQAKLTTIRSILAAFVNELVAKRRKPDEILSDEDAVAVIKHLVKQHKDSIVQFETGGRQDLADEERAELAFLESYLPAAMPREEIKKIAEVKMKDLGLREKADAGKLIGAVMKELRGQADGADVKAVVEELLY
jgi:uncharacterized protein YqeY